VKRRFSLRQNGPGHEVGELLPPRIIKITWVRGQSLMLKIPAKVSTLLAFSCNASFEEICVGSIVSGSQTDGMAFSHLP
jgi:hypothetical protein